jgi:hypothetical protein
MMEEKELREEISELKGLILDLSLNLSRKEDDEYIDIEEVCQLTGWKRNTVYQYHKNMNLP